MSKPNIKRKKIVSLIRGSIVSGKYRPGDRIPTRQQFVRQFKVSIATVQSALEELASERFISVDSTRGTFVSHLPPHLVSYALVFNSSPQKPELWSRFQAALCAQAAAAGLMPPGMSLTTHHSISSEHDESYQALLDDIQAHRLAGVIFAGDAFTLARTLFTANARLPKVIIGPSLWDVASVTPDMTHFYERAAQWLLSRGRRRVAVVVAGGSNFNIDGHVADVIALLTRNGVTVQPHWVQGAFGHTPAWARYAVRSLFHASQTHRPDALVIADDNFIPAAMLGLKDLGIQAPHDVQVVGHANFSSAPAPLPHESFPITRLGFDASTILRTCIRTLDSLRTNPLYGKTFIEPINVRVPAIFQHELEGTAT